MTRARYDELLAVAERWTIEAIRNPSQDAMAVAAGWQTVYRVVVHHFGWLGVRLRAQSGVQLETGPEPALARVAEAIGAAGDLLALHAGTTGPPLDDLRAIAAARRDLAALVVNTAFAVRSALDAAHGRGKWRVVQIRQHLDKVWLDLIHTMQVNDPGGELPAVTLAQLATSLSAPSSDRAGTIATAAARWSSLHRQQGADGVVTRDLRATTAQQRTTNAMTAHIAGGLIATATDHGLGEDRVVALVQLQGVLHRGDRALMTVERYWRHFDASGPGRSIHPAVNAHQAALDELRALVRPTSGGHLARGLELVPDPETARNLLAMVDDLSHTLAEVATCQAAVAARLASDRKLLISEVARGGRVGRLSWVKIYLPVQAEPLLTALDAVVPLAGEAARLSRIAAGTLHEVRPSAAGLTPAVRPIGRRAWCRPRVGPATAAERDVATVDRLLPPSGSI